MVVGVCGPAFHTGCAPPTSLIQRSFNDDDRCELRPGDPRRGFRWLRRRPAGRRARTVGRVDREEQGGRHLPALGLHPHQGVPARGRGRRQLPRGSPVRREVDVRRDRPAVAARVQGRHHRPPVQGPAGPDQVAQDHRRRGRGPLRGRHHDLRRGRPLHREERHPGQRLVLPHPARPGARRPHHQLHRGAEPGLRAEVGHRPRRRRHRCRVRLRVALLRRRRDHHRGPPPAGPGRGRVGLQAARARLPQARHQILHRHPLRQGRAGRQLGHRQPGERQGVHRRHPARRGRPWPRHRRTSGTRRPA